MTQTQTPSHRPSPQTGDWLPASLSASAPGMMEESPGAFPGALPAAPAKPVDINPGFLTRLAAHRRLHAQRITDGRDGCRRTVLTPSRDSMPSAMQAVTAWDRLHADADLRRSLRAVRKRLALPGLPLVVQGREYVAKYYVYNDVPRILEGLGWHTDAERNFCLQHQLRQAGLPAPAPLALLREHAGGIVRRAVLFTERIREATDYKEFVSRLETMDAGRRARFFADLGRALGRLHRFGAYTEDTDKNTLVRDTGGGFEFHFIDFDNTYPWRTPTLRRSLKAMGKFFPRRVSHGPGDRRAFLRGYLAARGRPDWRTSAEEALRI